MIGSHQVTLGMNGFDLLLTTGATGFISKNFSSNFTIGKNECDLTNLEATIKIIKEIAPTSIIHFAAKHDSGLTMKKNHVSYINDNTRIDLNILQAAHLANVDNVLMISSISSLMPTSTNSIKSSSLKFGDVDLSNFGYNFSKQIAIAACKSYQLDFARNYKSVLLGNIYGPNDNFNLDGNVIATIIYRTLLAREKGENLHLYGNGKDLRNFTYVKDLCAALPKILKDKTILDPTIVANPKPYTMIQIANIIKDKCGFIGNIIFDHQTNYIETRKIVDPTIVPWFMNNTDWTLFEKGVEETLELSEKLILNSIKQ